MADPHEEQYVDYTPVERHHPFPTFHTPPQTPRTRTPLIQLHSPYSPYSPSTPSEFHRRYDSAILNSPTPSEAVVKRAFRQDLVDTLPLSVEEEVELNEVYPTTPPRIPASGKTLEESPFHDSQGLVIDSKNWFHNNDNMKAENQWNGAHSSSNGTTNTVHSKKNANDEVGSDLDSYTPPKGTIRLLLNPLTSRDYLFLLLPSCLLSIAAAVVPMYMTLIIGDAFGVFSGYPLDHSLATSEQSHKLVKDVGNFCLRLTLVGLAGWIVNCAMISLWVRVGEMVAHRLRKAVYTSVMARGMEWFDMGMGLKGEDSKDNSSADAEESVGAAGLMAKFTRETDDVRIGCGMNMGQSVQDVCTFLACLVLALIKSWQLTLVTMSAIPLLVLVQVVTQVLANPMYAAERRALAEAGTHVERATSAMPTVKAFNAQQIELERFKVGVDKARRNYIGQSAVWAASQGMGNFIIMAMFIAGFWYGGKLVREDKISAATVMTVFWACLLGSASLQQLVPHLVHINHGKESMASLVGLMEAPSVVKPKARPESSHSTDTFLSLSSVTSAKLKNSRRPWSRSKPAAKTTQLAIRQIKPNNAKGEYNLENVTFAYPSRPENLVLDDVSLFLPAGETTFIVGGSGSGKSTVAQLLLRLYQPDRGEVTLDDQDIQYLDLDFNREHVAAVQQGCIMFDMSVHDNVAMGLAGLSKRKPEDATREEVIEACRMAMMHDFISDLPQQYETKLGTKGASLSGGQKQRLAIARARLRDPTVLILDEATSALDATSRILVFEAIKKWRKNRTTIVITHDLSQIQHNDFLYLMKNGRVVEQGFRSDLIMKENSEFGIMATVQAQVPFPAEDRDPWETGEGIEIMVEDDTSMRTPYLSLRPNARQSIRPQSVYKSNGYSAYLDILSDYHRPTVFASSDASSKRVSTLMVPGQRLSHRHSMLAVPNRLQAGSPLNVNRPGSSMSRRPEYLEDEQGFVDILEKKANEFPAPETQSPRIRNRRKWDASDEEASDIQIKIDGPEALPDAQDSFIQPSTAPPSILRLLVRHFRGIPQKYLGVLGLIGAVGHGILTPMWAKEIAILMSTVSVGGDNVSYISSQSLRVLGITIGDASALAGQYFFLEKMAGEWVGGLRAKAYNLVVAQPQAWFDHRENGSSRLVQILTKDAEDMMPMISTIIGQSTMVVVMIVAGIAWALVTGWKLTLIGMAVMPAFAVITLVQSKVLAILEARNKLAREQVARTFYESAANVRGIRAMALTKTFQTRFDSNLDETLQSGYQAAWGTGFGNGTAHALPYFVQALLIYVSAVFVSKGIYTFSMVMQVYSLILFSVTFASQFLDFVPAITKTRMATADFDRLRVLSMDTTEKVGNLQIPINGHIVFENVSFSYPTRADAPVLRDVNLELRSGDCVAIVGPSGSGKSTIASLLQRLYEPSGGSITLDDYNLSEVDVRWLRDHVAVVSQNANLFDATVAENIAYGTNGVPLEEIHRAAQAASVHDFIMSLPNGYETNLGENASLISGGQAQRLQIARALIRKANILILDECTSALDPENQKAVLDTIMRIKEGRTTIFVTHKADVMRRCDRVLCVEEGRIAEQGSYDQLIARRGVFAKLMRAGEWE